MIKFKFKISDFDHIDEEKIVKILPDYLALEKEGEDIFLTINAEDGTDETQAKFIIDRELDRLFFLTGKKVEYSLILIEYHDGLKRAGMDLRFSINAIQKIPDDIAPQQWENDIEIQLKLWSIAHSDNIPLAAKINLLFQIIEIEYSDTADQNIYPQYPDANSPPNPMTEAKLLRHLVSHGKAPIRRNQLIAYCNFLGIPSEMHDPTSVQFVNSINRRLPIITNLSIDIIERKITKF